MDELQDLRDQIDQIDHEIVRLFEERMKISSQVAQYKYRTGKQVFDREREIAKISALKKEAHSEFTAKGVEELFQQIMSMSRKLQYQELTDHGYVERSNFEAVDALPLENARVVFQGVEGAYSYEAMLTYFGDSITSYHVKTWREAMNEIVGGAADYAVLPIENSTAGIVADIYDLLMEYDLYIVGEQVIRCEHALLGLPEASLQDITDIYSHPQALAQCRMFLLSHPNWTCHEVDNTAAAASRIAEEKDPSKAAIASTAAAQFHGLKILQDHIYYNAENATRFIIVSGRKCYVKNSDKISICFELLNESGSLYNMLSNIIYNGLNMTKIESRPIPGMTWRYRFFIDFEGNMDQGAVKNALRGIAQEAKGLRVLGNY